MIKKSYTKYIYKRSFRIGILIYKMFEIAGTDNITLIKKPKSKINLKAVNLMIEISKSFSQMKIEPLVPLE